jgi:hypothetical protein
VPRIKFVSGPLARTIIRAADPTALLIAAMVSSKRKIHF